MTRILVLALVLAVAPAATTASVADCSRTSTGLVPLSDLKTKKYKRYAGGLYPNGKNSPPARYLDAGLAAAKRVRPVDGKIALLSIGMSNATQEFSAFMQLARGDASINPALAIVDGAQGGQSAARISDPNARFWSVVDQRLQQAGVTRAQVQVVWLKEANARPTEPFPQDARILQGQLRAIIGILAQRFPNLRLVYLSSRTYGGYASTPLNPEPYAYQSGFAVKWTVADRIAGRIKGPWVGWGPYLWADGTRARSDGLVWSCSDFRQDGTHPSESGRRKVAERLLRFMKTNRTAKSWFLG